MHPSLDRLVEVASDARRTGRCIHDLTKCEWCNPQGHDAIVNGMILELKRTTAATAESMRVAALPQAVYDVLPVPSTDRHEDHASVHLDWAHFPRPIPRKQYPSVVVRRHRPPDETSRLFDVLAAARPDWVKH